jgi:hypothetical protein
LQYKHRYSRAEEARLAQSAHFLFGPRLWLLEKLFASFHKPHPEHTIVVLLVAAAAPPCPHVTHMSPSFSVADGSSQLVLLRSALSNQKSTIKCIKTRDMSRVVATHHRGSDLRAIDADLTAYHGLVTLLHVLAELPTRFRYTAP